MATSILIAYLRLKGKLEHRRSSGCCSPEEEEELITELLDLYSKLAIEDLDLIQDDSGIQRTACADDTFEDPC